MGCWARQRTAGRLMRRWWQVQPMSHPAFGLASVPNVLPGSSNAIIRTIFDAPDMK